ncbi:MAG: hypothetical protein V4658_02290 [Bacteroidota bacterium]
MRYLCIFILTWLTCTHKLFAQKAEPLSKLHVQASVSNPFYVSFPYTWFSINPVAFRLQAGANLYQGELFLAVARNSFTSDSLPDFTSTLFTLGYCLNIPLHKTVWIKPAIALGNTYMQFGNIPDLIAYRLHRNESELTFEASLHVQAKLYKKLHASLGVSAQRTLLYHNFDVANAAFALTYYFDTPKIIKKIID